MIIADMHTHCAFSGDSETPPEEQLTEALRHNAKYYCFTDHMDMYIPEGPDADGFAFEPFVLDVPAYTKKIEELSREYADRVNVLTGIELGLHPAVFAEYKKLLASCRFDFVLGSIHTVDDLDPYYDRYWIKHPGRTGVELYFNTMLDCLNGYDDFDSLAHLDYVIRYCRNEKGEPALRNYSYNDFGEQIDEVLKWVISHDKALEVNTAGIKYGLGRPNPSGEVLKRYKELGGSRITIGSDGHKPEHIFYAFPEVEALLKSLGFTSYEVFKDRKPMTFSF